MPNAFLVWHDAGRLMNKRNTFTDFIAVTAPTSPAAFTLNKITDLRIAISRAAKDTQLATADNLTL